MPPRATVPSASMARKYTWSMLACPGAAVSTNEDCDAERESQADISGVCARVLTDWYTTHRAVGAACYMCVRTTYTNQPRMPKTKRESFPDELTTTKQSRRLVERRPKMLVMALHAGK